MLLRRIITNIVSPDYGYIADYYNVVANRSDAKIRMGTATTPPGRSCFCRVLGHGFSHGMPSSYIHHRAF